MWKIWCKALGQKEGKSNREADAVAVIRTLILLGYMITNSFIVAGVVRHWDAVECVTTDTGTLEFQCLITPATMKELVTI